MGYHEAPSPVPLVRGKPNASHAPRAGHVPGENSWPASITTAVAQSVSLVNHLGIDTEHFLSRRQFGRWAGIGMAGTAVATTGATTGATTAATAACTGPAHPSLPPIGSHVGFVLAHEQFRTDQLVSFAHHAEQAGFGLIWASDHLQPWQDNQGHSMFPWLTLALVGEHTAKVPFGSGVTCPTYHHHPVDVAHAFASLALLAPGRVFLGVGTGEALNEQSSTAHYGRYRERHDRLVEAIELIRRLWTGQRISFQGRYFQTDQLRLYDVPPQPPPIYVAASGPKSARLAGQYGDGWIGQSASITDPRMGAAFADGARAAGRNPDGMPRLAEAFAVVGDQATIESAAQLWRFTAAGSDQPNPVAIQQFAQQVSLQQVAAHWTTGTNPAAHIHTVQRLLDIGATPFMHFPQPDPDQAIDFYHDEVLPHLRH